MTDYLQVQREIISLERLVEESASVFLDTSIIANYSPNRGENFSDTYNSRMLWRRLLERDFELYITPKVRDEFLGTAPDSLRTLQKRMKDRTTKRFRFYKEVRTADEEKQRLIREFELNGKVFQLRKHQRERFDLLYLRYLELKEKYGLSETNYDLLISGASVYNREKKVALVSNDINGISRAWNKLLIYENLSESDFGFFARKSLVEFERFVRYPPSLHQSDPTRL